VIVFFAGRSRIARPLSSFLLLNPYLLRFLVCEGVSRKPEYLRVIGWTRQLVSGFYGSRPMALEGGPVDARFRSRFLVFPFLVENTLQLPADPGELGLMIISTGAGVRLVTSDKRVGFARSQLKFILFVACRWLPPRSPLKLLR